MKQDFRQKLEDMLVIPFMVIIYSCLVIPLGILCYQGYQWLVTDEWPGLSLASIFEGLGSDLSVLSEPGWMGLNHILVAVLEWPLSITSFLLILITGWLVLFAVGVFAEFILRWREHDEPSQATTTVLDSETAHKQ